MVNHSPETGSEIWKCRLLEINSGAAAQRYCVSLMAACSAKCVAETKSNRMADVFDGRLFFSFRLVFGVAKFA